MSWTPRHNFAWLIGLAASVCVHVTLLEGLGQEALWKQKKPTPVKVRIVEKKKEEPKPPPPPPPPPPKPKEKPKPKPKPKEKVASEKHKKPPPNQPPPPPVHGLSADAMSKGGKVAVPLGNTLMTEDQGKRLKEAPPPLDADLSADAKLDHASIVTPKYTDGAIDASLEGVFVVDVYVDESGKVTQAELRRKVGYGMDPRILEAARGAHFTPRKNKLGRPEAGWTEIKFNLQIPGT